MNSLYSVLSTGLLLAAFTKEAPGWRRIKNSHRHVSLAFGSRRGRISECCGWCQHWDLLRLRLGPLLLGELEILHVLRRAHHLGHGHLVHAHLGHVLNNSVPGAHVHPHHAHGHHHHLAHGLPHGPTHWLTHGSTHGPPHGHHVLGQAAPVHWCHRSPHGHTASHGRHHITRAHSGAGRIPPETLHGRPSLHGKPTIKRHPLHGTTTLHGRAALGHIDPVLHRLKGGQGPDHRCLGLWLLLAVLFLVVSEEVMGHLRRSFTL
mmetsp:Transcript_29779/g.67488  ORF Transcript_29779/g.67488 Transcript_29779/m.67488 type:complete len:262 (-) Transcript_29779:125-910(-)